MKTKLFIILGVALVVMFKPVEWIGFLSGIVFQAFMAGAESADDAIARINRGMRGIPW